MTTKTTIVLTLAALCAPLFAVADPIKVKGSELAALRSNLQVLSDGSVERVVDQGKDIYGNKQPEKVARTPFEFTGKVRTSLIKNIAVIAAEEKKIQTTQEALAKAYGITAETKAEDPANKKALKELNDLLAQPVTMELTKFSLEELNLEKNPLGSTISFLAPLINELSPPIVEEKVAKSSR